MTVNQKGVLGMGCQIEKLNRDEKARLNVAYGCDELGR